MSVIKVGIFFLKLSWERSWTQLFLHPTPISGSYSSDFAYRLYPGLIVKKLKIKFSQKGLEIFLEILDLSTPNTREKYLLKANCLHFFLSELQL